MTDTSKKKVRPWMWLVGTVLVAAAVVLLLSETLSSDLGARHLRRRPVPVTEVGDQWTCPNVECGCRAVKPSPTPASTSDSAGVEDCTFSRNFRFSECLPHHEDIIDGVPTDEEWDDVDKRIERQCRDLCKLGVDIECGSYWRLDRSSAFYSRCTEEDLACYYIRYR